jgi:hypothetical protein
MNDDKLPCGIPRAGHKVCWERNCYLSGEGCPIHQGVKKHIIPHLPEYVHNTVLVDGIRIFVGGDKMRMEAQE